jgi:hypothetical protein
MRTLSAAIDQAGESVRSSPGNGSAAELDETAANNGVQSQGLLPLFVPQDWRQLSVAQAGVTTGCLLITEIAAPTIVTLSKIQAATTKRECRMLPSIPDQPTDGG